jgi:hypothetical protein
MKLTQARACNERGRQLRRPNNGQIMRSQITLAVALPLLSGCSDRKEPAFAECSRIFIIHQPTVSDELKMRSVDLCMRARGYKRDEVVCNSLAKLGLACFSPNWPWYLLHVFG